MKTQDFIYALFVFIAAHVIANYVYDKFFAPNIKPVVM